MAPGPHPDVQGVRKKFQMTNFTMANNISSMKYALKSVPGLADVGDPHGGEDGPVALAPGPRSKIRAYHFDQREKLKGFDIQHLAKSGPQTTYSILDYCNMQQGIEIWYRNMV